MTESVRAGAVDTTFDDDGEVLIRNFYESGLALQPDGKIVVAGTVWQERGQGVVGNLGLVTDLHDYDFALARYNSDGSLDTTFGEDGEVTTHLGEIYGSKIESQTDRAYAVALQPDSKILVAGTSDGDVALVRYNADGSLDATFGGGGAIVAATGPSAAYSIVLQTDGKILVSGLTRSSAVVARYNADGSPDATFGSGGTFIFNDGYGTGFYYDTLTNLALQPSGKILAAGSRYNYANGNYDFAVVRIKANGTLDTMFGQEGRVTTDISGYDSARSIAVQPDGRIVVAGASDDGFTLVRYNRNGTLDTTFDGDGRVTTAIGESSGAYSIALQADGKIVAAGESVDSGQSIAAFARYNPDGSLDTTFDRDGTLTVAVSELTFIPSHVAIQSDGNIVASEGQSGFGSALIRLLGGGLNLSGTAGDDTLNGGPGDDTLVAGRGSDAILGGEGRDSILGGAGNDTVQGMAGNDTIDGGAGNDILFGGADIDTVSYGSSAGSGVTISLAATGAQISGGAGTDTLSGFEGLIGSGFADRLGGNNRDNTLQGLSGDDTLRGAGGADKFVFNTPLNEGINVDRITDFDAVDVIRLDNDFFTGLATGSLAPGRFYSANGADAANDAGDRIVYNSRSGNLYFDSDGTAGPAEAIWFAKLTGAPAITAADFFVIS